MVFKTGESCWPPVLRYRSTWEWRGNEVYPRYPVKKPLPLVPGPGVWTGFGCINYGNSFAPGISLPRYGGNKPGPGSSETPVILAHRGASPVKIWPQSFLITGHFLHLNLENFEVVFSHFNAENYAIIFQHIGILENNSPKRELLV